MSGIIGVIGGMGPLASAHFYYSITQKTNALTDADHLRIVIDSNPQIHDRTDSILNNHPRSLEDILESVEGLSRYNPDCIAIICNSAFNYYQDIQNNSSCPVIDLIQLSTDHIQQNYCDQQFSILGTKALKAHDIYGAKLEKVKVGYGYPSDEVQNDVHDLIYRIKAGHPLAESTAEMIAIIDSQNDIEDGQHSFLLACTELSILSKQLAHSRPDLIFVDPVEILIDHLVEAYS